MTSYVLIAGACHGGWWYDDLVVELEARGHSAVAVSLEGLDPDRYSRDGLAVDGGGAAAAPITLASHVEQAARAVTAAASASASAGGGQGEGVVLVGHSYAGSVITGVADRHPEAVRALVYLDAFVPENGDSCFTLTNDEQRAWYIDGSGRTGFAVDPLPFFDERARPHPLATLVQKSELTGAWQAVATKVYAAAEWPGESPFATSIARVRADGDWVFHQWATRHNVMHDGPGRVLALLLGLRTDVRTDVD